MDRDGHEELADAITEARGPTTGHLSAGWRCWEAGGVGGRQRPGRRAEVCASPPSPALLQSGPLQLEDASSLGQGRLCSAHRLKCQEAPRMVFSSDRASGRPSAQSSGHTALMSQV